MMTPHNKINLVEVLTAAAPIVASVMNKNKVEVIDKTNEERKSTPNINITINNHFHVTSEKDIIDASQKVQEQIIDSTTRYLI